MARKGWEVPISYHCRAKEYNSGNGVKRAPDMLRTASDETTSRDTFNLTLAQYRAPWARQDKATAEVNKRVPSSSGFTIRLLRIRTLMQSPHPNQVQYNRG